MKKRIGFIVGGAHFCLYGLMALSAWGGLIPEGFFYLSFFFIDFFTGILIFAGTYMIMWQPFVAGALFPMLEKIPMGNPIVAFVLHFLIFGIGGSLVYGYVAGKISKHRSRNNSH